MCSTCAAAANWNANNANKRPNNDLSTHQTDCELPQSWPALVRDLMTDSNSMHANSQPINKLTILANHNKAMMTVAAAARLKLALARRKQRKNSTCRSYQQTKPTTKTTTAASNNKRLVLSDDKSKLCAQLTDKQLILLADTNVKLEQHFAATLRKCLVVGVANDGRKLVACRQSARKNVRHFNELNVSFVIHELQFEPLDGYYNEQSEDVIVISTRGSILKQVASSNAPVQLTCLDSLKLNKQNEKLRVKLTALDKQTNLLWLLADSSLIQTSFVKGKRKLVVSKRSKRKIFVVDVETFDVFSTFDVSQLMSLESAFNFVTLKCANAALCLISKSKICAQFKKQTNDNIDDTKIDSNNKDDKWQICRIEANGHFHCLLSSSSQIMDFIAFSGGDTPLANKHLDSDDTTTTSNYDQPRQANNSTSHHIEISKYARRCSASFQSSLTKLLSANKNSDKQFSTIPKNRLRDNHGNTLQLALLFPDNKIAIFEFVNFIVVRSKQIKLDSRKTINGNIDKFVSIEKLDSVNNTNNRWLLTLFTTQNGLVKVKV